ncbi:PTS mannose/fructose/sorbose/N-acetylgalactosamine transporter subunit IIC [Anaerococcus lactolyticus]|uniref:PTS system sorbose-specific iic component n=2 Tax=Anaerococcus lactolyticus TaxID=33032 RepID=C2BHA8_9FIRM|nr:PTS sugar transporter subunit IIC [Anaerococcus lactolyticus]EEI85751.1 PTS system sorbose-specific iic component [Anaerococcus lactolyticus ATCC 51172]KGF04704.1 PTS sugar transporter [Anaerococcus lactolyticus S7-1-13]
MLREAILLALIMLLGRSEFFLGTALIQRPIVIGPLVGLVFGDLHTGLVMGATLELAFIGAVSIGSYIPPDMLSGTVLGVAFAIKAGSGPETALTLGMPIASLMLALRTIVGSPLLVALGHLADKHVADGKYKMFTFDVLVVPFLVEIMTSSLVPIAYYFGSDAVTSALGGIPEFITTGIEIATGMLPALGFAMLAQMIMNKKVAPYFFLGYFLLAYFSKSGLTTTGIAIFSIIMAAIGFFKQDEVKEVNLTDSEQEGYVLDEF